MEKRLFDVIGEDKGEIRVVNLTGLSYEGKRVTYMLIERLYFSSSSYYSFQRPFFLCLVYEG